MSSPREKGHASVGRTPAPETLTADLALLLSKDRAAYLFMSPQGAVFSVKTPETQAIGESITAEWVRMSPRARVRRAIDWIHRAAEYYRKPNVPKVVEDAPAA